MNGDFLSGSEIDGSLTRRIFDPPRTLSDKSDASKDWTQFSLITKFSCQLDSITRPDRMVSPLQTEVIWPTLCGLTLTGHSSVADSGPYDNRYHLGTGPEKIKFPKFKKFQELSFMFKRRRDISVKFTAFLPRLPIFLILKKFLIL